MDRDTGAVKAWLNRGGDTTTTSGWIERGQIAKGGLAGATDAVVLAQFNCDRMVDYLVVRADRSVDGDGRDDYLLVDNRGKVDAYLNRSGDPA